MINKNDPQKALVVLIIIFLILFAAGLGSRGITMYKIADALLISPVKKISLGFRHIGTSFLNTRAFFISKKSLLIKNKELLKENEDLKNQIAILRSKEMQNERLKEILNLKSGVNYNFIAANVIGNTEMPFRFVIIDKGTSSGVKIGSPVVTVNAETLRLIGLVYSVSSHTAKILLPTDPRFFVSVKDAYTGELGVAQGNRDSLKIEFKMKTPKIASGDPLLTTSISSIYPQNILVGRIYSVKKSGNITTTALIKPAADFENLFEVLIIEK